MPETVAGTTLRLTRTFSARRDEVFRAWTEPERMQRWLGPPGGSTRSVDADLRVGGRYRIEMAHPPEMVPEGASGTYSLVGSYREISPPERLVFTFTWAPPVLDFMDIGETLVTVEFLDRGGTTDLVLTHERLPTESHRLAHRWGWTGGLDKLAELLARS